MRLTVVVLGWVVTTVDHRNPQRQDTLRDTSERLRDDDAHLIAESVFDCVIIADKIPERLKAGERP
jgi:hypothetical protein